MKHHTFFELFFKAKHPVKILEMHYHKLQVEYDGLLAREGENIQDSISSKIKDLLNDEQKNWHKVYQTEQYLSHIYDSEAVDVNLKRKLFEYKNHFPEETYKHYKEELNKIIIGNNNLNDKRALLIAIQSELHTFYLKRSECHEYGLLARLRISLNFMIAITVFISSLIYYYYFNHMSKANEMIILVLASGFLGASFSLINSLGEQLKDATLEDLKILHRQNYISKRIFIGMGASLITYFLLQSGFVSHFLSPEILPSLPISSDQGNDTYQNISKLLIWSFLAGFSERLVPSLLGRVENRFNMDEAKTINSSDLNHH